MSNNTPLPKPIKDKIAYIPLQTVIEVIEGEMEYYMQFDNWDAYEVLKQLLSKLTALNKNSK